MLDKSMTTLTGLSSELHHLAEEMAAASLVSAFGEDLLPQETSVETVRKHQESETEDWLRALSSSVASIGAIHKLGYKLQRPDEPAAQHPTSSNRRTIHGGTHD